MKVVLRTSVVLAAAFTLTSTAVLVSNLFAQSESAPAAQTGLGSDQGRGMRGMGGAPGARGVLGTVTEVAADHYTIKTDTGDLYTIHYSVNTRILKQPPGRAGGRDGGGRRPQADNDSNESGGERAQPQALKPTDIKVGDMITAGGELDASNKSVGAVFILQLDPERAKQARAMQANYGKTWLAGRVTGIDGTKITIDGMVDHAPHAIVVDENTSFHKRRDAITLADIQPGDQLRADGALKDGAFVATAVSATEFQQRQPGSGTQSPAGTAPPAQQPK